MNLFATPRRLVAASFVAVFPVCAHSALVFQADFNGPGSGTGGPGDIVAYGGTGSILNINPAQSNVDVAFLSANPLAAGTGAYVRLTDRGQRTNANRPAGVTFFPKSPANSFDSWYADTSATLGHDSLEGAFDFLFRTSSTQSLGQNTFRFFDVNGGDSGFRVALASTSVNNLHFTLNQAGVTFLSAGTSSSSGNTVNLEPDTTYRIAGTISTAHTGLVTMKLFLAKGNVAIDTKASTHLLASRTSTSVLDRDNKISDAFGSAAGFQFGLMDNLDPDTKTLDIDSFRLYNAVPATFATTPERGR